MPAVSAPPTRAILPTALAAASASTGSQVTVKTSRRYVAKRFILFAVSPIFASVSWSTAYTPAKRLATSVD